MDFGTGVREVICFDLSQQHRPLDSLRFWQLRSFGFGQLEQGPTHAARLRVTVAPPPVLDELPRALHGFVFDQAGLDLRQGDKDSATFLLGWAMPLPLQAALRNGDGAGTSHCRAAWPGCFCVACHRRVENIWGRGATHTPSNGWCSTTCPVKGLFSEGPAPFHRKSARRTRRRSCGSASSR